MNLIANAIARLLRRKRPQPLTWKVDGARPGPNTCGHCHFPFIVSTTSGAPYAPDPANPRERGPVLCDSCASDHDPARYERLQTARRQPYVGAGR